MFLAAGTGKIPRGYIVPGKAAANRHTNNRFSSAGDLATENHPHLYETGQVCGKWEHECVTCPQGFVKAGTPQRWFYL